MTASQVTRCPYVPLVLLLLWISWTLLHPASAYPVGPPTSACETMTPEHEVAAQSTDSPYIITLSSTSYTPGEPLTGRSTNCLNNAGLVCPAKSKSRKARNCSHFRSAVTAFTKEYRPRLRFGAGTSPTSICLSE